MSGVRAVDPARLDRAVAAAAADLAAARRALRLAVAEGRDPSTWGSPLEAHRDVSSRTTWLELGEAPPHPIFVGARAWVEALTLDRVGFALEARTAAAWARPSVTVEGEGMPSEQLSVHALRARVLADPIPARRRFYALALERGAAPVGELVRRAAERRAEAARRLGSSLDALELPCDADALTAAARAVLDRTEALIEPARMRGASYAEPLVAALGRDATEGWPARLSPRWIEETFRATDLARGLAIDLGALPEPLGATSFARALASFGDAFAVAAAPRAAPFVLARRPFDLRRARRAALFGALVADPVFGRRALGLGRDRARDQARTVARALLSSLRLDAARVLLRGALAAGGSDLAHRFEEATERALGVPFSPALAGVLPALSPRDGVRFAGSLLAASDARALRERFDEDWFRSPHAALALRDEEATIAPSERVAATEIEMAVDELERAATARIT